MKKVASLLAVAALLLALNTGYANAYTFALIGTEPGSMALLGIGMLALVIYGKRRMNYLEA